jgi:hypothetical protein
MGVLARTSVSAGFSAPWTILLARVESVADLLRIRLQGREGAVKKHIGGMFGSLSASSFNRVGFTANGATDHLLGRPDGFELNGRPAAPAQNLLLGLDWKIHRLSQVC